MFVRASKGGGGGVSGNGYYMGFVPSTYETHLFLNGVEVKTFDSNASTANPQEYDDDSIYIKYKGNNNVDFTFKKACTEYRANVNPISRAVGTTITSQTFYNYNPCYFVYA